MKRPSSFTMVLGHPIVATATGLSLAFAALMAWQGKLNGVLLLLVFVVTAYSAQAFRQREDYRKWQRDWDAMGDAPKKPSFLARHPIAQIIAFGGIWVVLNALASRAVTGSAAGLLSIWFWTGNVILIGVLIWRLRGFIRLPARPAPVECVSVRLAPLRQSPPAGATVAELPAYCRHLLADERSLSEES